MSRRRRPGPPDVHVGRVTVARHRFVEYLDAYLAAWDDDLDAHVNPDDDDDGDGTAP